MFGLQYIELAQAIDEIAERILTLGEHAPGSYKEVSALTSIEEAEDQPSADEMLRQLLEGQEVMIRTARAVLPIAGEADDEPPLVYPPKAFKHTKRQHGCCAVC